MLADRANAQPAHDRNAFGQQTGSGEGASGISDEEAADLVSKLVRNGVPLTLIADLLSPSAPDSEQILAEEREEAERTDPDDFSPTSER